MTDLYPWLEYQFRIIATNEHGSGEASIPSLKVKTWDAGKDRTYARLCAGVRSEIMTFVSFQPLWFPQLMWPVMEAETVKSSSRGQ